MFSFVKRNLILVLIFANMAVYAQTQPSFTYQGFADFGFMLDRNQNGFVVGQLDNFINSRLSNKWSFLGEIVVEGEFESGQTEVFIDPERLILTYDHNDYFKLEVGKFHTPIGYWNNAYHHGSVLQPTIERPALFYFEDEGGSLPIHSVGMQLRGSNIGKLGFSYTAMVCNGNRSPYFADDNTEKAYVLQLGIKPFRDIQVLGSAYYENILQGSINYSGLPLTESMQLGMYGLSVVHMTPSSKFEAIGEWVLTSVNGKQAGTHVSNSFAGYLGYNLGKFTPYTSYSLIDYHDTDPYFVARDYWSALIGVRYAFEYNLVLKLECEHVEQQFSPVVNKVLAQIAFQF
jgi:hypothetical protein